MTYTVRQAKEKLETITKAINDRIESPDREDWKEAYRIYMALGEEAQELVEFTNNELASVETKVERFNAITNNA